MGIVAKALWRSTVGAGLAACERKAVCLRARPALESCAPRLRQSPGLERVGIPGGRD